MRRLLKLLVAGVVAAVVVGAAFVAWYVLTRDDAPDAVDLSATVERLAGATTAPPQAGGDETAAAQSGPTGGAESGDSDPAASSASSDGGAGSAAGGGLAGTWQLQASDDPGDLQDQPTVSFAGFRVDEVLSTIGDFTAAGRTADVSGTVELSDTELLAAEVTVMMSTLRTDNSFRDGRIYEALNTSDFPTATFVLAAPLGLPPGLADGEAFSGVAEGDLTIKGVTNRVSFSLEAQLLGDRLLAVGRSEVVFSDYGVTAPTAPIVVSVEDHGIMEFQLFFAR
ncbi:MAG: YceI family protein [Acidimicrobiaceae bacterium]|nr:YceI family protein [Acidimicrobiaceae bacterium]